MHIAAAVLAALPPDTMIAIRQVGDFGLSLPLSLSLSMTLEAETMSEMPTTLRFALPMLAVAQAQKAVTYKEALTLIDALDHAKVEGGPLNDRPAEPDAG
ncbi:hypothetical protein [Sphingopyxis sp.]|uniref:hypothetical protein n=1 Tax=Sphingopyxis sp. TaxID=1908224 RepID=UPI0025D75413|nr:hypothetical protein [Sphingopyxis sp.]